MVPGAERKLREHQRLHAEYTEKHLCSGQQRQQYDSIRLDRPKYEAECGPLLNKTPPDVCTMNKCIDFVDTTDTNTNSALLSGIIEPDFTETNSLAGQTVPITVKNNTNSALLSGIIEPDFTETNSLAGQTVPITVKNHHGSASIHNQTPLSSYSNFSVNKYGTLPHLNTGSSGTTLHQGFLGVSELGSSSSNSSVVGYCARSKTLQHQRPKKKCVKIESFQTPQDTGFADFSKRSNTFGYSGSAV
ncbi:hypothetical protein QE152_g35969 [Popillia japonica]|uniref:Uncharacterized protein n=1 Tax=Popillia japonica TaxID=7064 RepID=A0AAW1IEN9_POPJA